MPQSFDVYSFRSSSDLLNAYVSHRKSLNRHFSISGWAKKLELPTSGILVNFLKKRRLPTEDFIIKLTQSMELDPSACEYVATLVATERAKHANSLAHVDLEKKLNALRFKYKKQIYPEAEFNTDLSLAFMAVKVLLENRIPGLGLAEMQSRLRIPCGSEKLEAILSRLLHLGVIERTADGSYRTLVENIETENDLPSEVIRAFHRESLTYAAGTLDTVPVDLRHFDSYVLAVQSSRLPEAKKVIENFISQFVTQFQMDGTPADQVYQLNLNLVPLTRSET